VSLKVTRCGVVVHHLNKAAEREGISAVPAVHRLVGEDVAKDNSTATPLEVTRSGAVVNIMGEVVVAQEGTVAVFLKAEGRYGVIHRLDKAVGEGTTATRWQEQKYPSR
jgi:hypothetical protein